MEEFFENLFTSNGFMPHGHCYFWRPDILWTHVISDGFIAAAYFSIPICLAFIYLHRKDVGLRWLLGLFAIFIIGCGITHIMGIITVWNPIYRLDGIFKAITAVASVGTAAMLLKLTPNLIRIPTKQDWDDVNEELRQQLQQLEEKDEELRQQIQQLQEKEEALQQSEERYRNLMHLFDGVFICVDKKIVFANPSAAKLLGAANPRELTGKPVEGFIHPDYVTSAAGRAAQLEKGEVTALTEEKIVRLDGSEIDVEITSMPLLYNQMPAVQNIARDITERKQSERMLRESESKFRSVFESSIIGIIFWHVDGSVTDANDTYLDIIGYTREELLAGEVNWRNMTPEVYAPVYEKVANELTQHGKNMPFEKEYVRKDGTHIPVLVSSNLLDSRTDSGIAFVLDITERKRADKKLQQTLNELKQRNHELDNYVYKVSHDLRAPLTSIMGLINIMKLETNPAEKDKYVELMENRTVKLDQFIQSILSHSRTLNTDVVVHQVDFRRIILEAYEELRYMPHSEKITLSVDVTGDSEFYGDELRLSIILKNFISNAIKYLNPYQPQPFVKVSIAIRANDAGIIIADNGQGIDPAYVDKIFNMFFRATSTSDGSGLGLYIVQQTIERLGGSIRVESEMGKGTTFFIQLPNEKEV